MSTITAAATSTAARLKEKIQNKTAKVGIVGLGYVGLPLAVEFGHAGFEVIGIDIQQSKVDEINRGVSYIQDIPTEQVRELVRTGKVAMLRGPQTSHQVPEDEQFERAPGVHTW